MSDLLKYSALILTLAFNVSFCFATSCESTATPSGVWSDDSTWGCGNAPGAGVCYDTIIIRQNTYKDEMIERSKDGSNFEKIGDINGSGNSSVEINYSFIDNRTSAGMLYYRLKQTDYDGSTTYSQIVIAEIPNDIEIKLYPNPATEFFTLQGKIAGKLDIYTTNGKLIQTIENYEGEFISVEYLDRGTYLITYLINRRIKTKKLTLK